MSDDRTDGIPVDDTRTTPSTPPRVPCRPAGGRGDSANGARAAFVALLCSASAVAGGCGGVTLIPNSDPALRKTRTQFADDAELRHPFKADAPSGGEAKGRAMVDYGADTLQVANLSDEDWDNVEIWLNRQYVVFLPRVAKNAPKTTTLHFQMIYDEKGNSFPTDNRANENRIHQLEMLRDGKMYTLKLELED